MTAAVHAMHRAVALARTSGAARVVRRFTTPAGALVLYVVIAVGFFGLPVLSHLDSEVVGSGYDPSLFTWSLAWWPHALGDGLNPFFTHALFWPDGFNLAWSTSLPGPSIVAAPVTLLAGPVAATNVLLVLAPALSAWTAFLLCRYITRSPVASFVGGYVFGFSSYELSHTLGHLNLSLVPMVPLAVYLTLRHIDGLSSARQFVVSMTLTLTFQFLTSTEVFASLAVFGALAWLLAFVLHSSRRPQLLAAGRSIVFAYAGTALLISPFLVYVLRAGVRPAVYPEVVASDLANFFLPTPMTRLGRHYFGTLAEMFSGGNLLERSAYFGVFLLGILASYLIAHWRSAHAKVLALLASAAAIASLGPHVHIVGVRTLPSPLWPFPHVPLLRYLLPARIVLYAWLAAAIVIALWLSERTSIRRWGVAGLAIASIVPDLSMAAWHHPYLTPAFFEHGRYRGLIRPSDRVLVLPFPGLSMLWHARTEMGFTMVGGYSQLLPRDYRRWAIIPELQRGDVTPNAPYKLRRFIAGMGVTAVVVDARAPAMVALVRTLGAPIRAADGVSFLRVAPAPGR